MEHISLLDETDGPLRATHDGTYLDEATGEYLALDPPQDGTVDRNDFFDSFTKPRRAPVAMPEMKNGATGLDAPRDRKSVSRVLKNWWNGNNHPPAPPVPQLFVVGEEPPSVENVKEMVKMRRRIHDKETKGLFLDLVRKYWDGILKDQYDSMWIPRAESDESFMREVEEFAVKLARHHEMLREMDEEDAAAAASDRADELARQRKRRF